MEIMPREVLAMAGVCVTMVSACADHAAAVSEDGLLYLFGAYDEPYYAEVAPLEALRGEHIVSASVSVMYVTALTREGDLFAYGSGFALGDKMGDDERERLVRVDVCAHEQCTGLTPTGRDPYLNQEYEID